MGCLTYRDLTYTPANYQTVQGDTGDLVGKDGGVNSSFELQLIRMSHTTSVLSLIPLN